MRIALDAMGSDAHPQPEVEAAVEALRRWGDPILLAGRAEVLRPALAPFAAESERIEIVDAPEVVEMADRATEAARGKPLTSMAVGIELLREGRADAFVTAGNTGGAMANALLRLGRIRGVKRPALTALFPVRGGQAAVLDIGANAECRPEFLLQFALLGSVYAQLVLDRPHPRVGLLSNGEEPGKGDELVKAAFPLLAASGLNFIGNVEPKEVYAGKADVVVTDGFTGNIFLKASEAVASFLVSLLREHIRAGAVTSLGGLLSRPAFRRVGRLMDPAEYGAVPLLGVDGLVFIGHGRSDARALVNALAVARQAVARGLLDALRRVVQARLEAVPTEAVR